MSKTALALRNSTTWIILSLLIAAGIGAFAWRRFDAPLSHPSMEASVAAKLASFDGSEAEETAAEPAEAIVQLDQEQWKSSGIEIGPARQAGFSRSVHLTGKIALNQDRVAHIYPMVEGTVDSVLVQLGQQVQADDLLVVIHSREIGEAKLQLYQARLQHEMAIVKDELERKIAENTGKLIETLRKQRPIEEIQPLFRNLSMGDNRERLLSSYAGYVKSEADVTRLEGLAESGAISGKQLLAAEANRNADLATFQSRIEQIDYELETSLLRSSQLVKETETQVAVAETSLRILGYEQNDLNEIDPARQGEAISHYPIRAPFDGTVLSKDVVLREQVRPDVSVLSVADLSTVWITADVYEEHVPLLASLDGKKVRIHNEAWPDRSFEANVFYTGDVMDESSRTIPMRAIADNVERLLKPGMFVTVELPASSEADVLQVPQAAVQEHEGRKFVFIHLGEDRFARRDIKVGKANEKMLVVQAGLKRGEPVVVEGGFVLKSLMLAELMGE